MQEELLTSVVRFKKEILLDVDSTFVSLTTLWIAVTHTHHSSPPSTHRPLTTTTRTPPSSTCPAERQRARHRSTAPIFLPFYYDDGRFHKTIIALDEIS